MSRFNVTLAVAASCAALVMEGCKSSENKKAAKMFDDYAKKMKEVTDKENHTFEDCDKIQTDFLKAVADEATKEIKDSKEYKAAKKVCEGKDEFKGKDNLDDNADFKKCIEDEIAARAASKAAKENKDDKKDKKEKKDKKPKDEDKLLKSEKAFVQEYGNCYYKATPSKEDFTAIVAYYPGYTLEVKDKKVEVTYKAPETPAEGN